MKSCDITTIQKWLVYIITGFDHLKILIVLNVILCLYHLQHFSSQHVEKKTFK